MTDEVRHSIKISGDYLLRKRILKLRWIGLDDEADLLAARHKAQLLQCGAFPQDPGQTE